ncbi:MAG: helix-hairpin-helix domain-containing protein [Actinobacteria bacterium]|nr:helix-hairpin-helix domain-containing protein [Actinomycetota bacterium]
MHVADKLDVLAAGARYDLACACGGGSHRVRGPLGRWVYPAVLPSGESMRLLKVLLSNSCSRNCLYCPQRRGRDFVRQSFKPEELAATYMEMFRSGAVTGLFLSSAITETAESSMDDLLRTVELLRFHHHYRGWLHLKVLPGARRGQVERAAALANRLSLNLEAPTAARLKRISPQKDFMTGIYERMGWIRELISGRSARCRGQTTQLVVGAGGETDAEFIGLSGKLYADLKLSRIYYSAFQPVPDTPLAHRPPASFDREHRLYQTDFLLRKYGFGAGEFILGEDGNLPLDTDPKTAWARQHPEFFPVEINKAGRAELLRVPGIGPVAARRIVRQRLKERFSSLEDLKRAGALARRAVPYILLNGRRPQELRGAQLSLL